MVRVLVTAGPTREPIDEVRYLSNRSSGRMGYALAEAARRAGHRVTLVSGPTCISPPAGVRFVPVTTAEEMRRAVRRVVRVADAVLMCAAVADWRPRTRHRGKLRRETRPKPLLRLVPNPDILAELGRRKGSRTLVGFALEPGATFGARGPLAGRLGPAERNARRKLRRKNLDWIVLNGPEALEGDRTSAAAIARDGRVLVFRNLRKAALARALVGLVVGK
ncbi:MAG: phosphopantothenoylcysteine decarboxylase [Planctomycetes bacterium]|nr:phosphopantothenoylcysteine decarboxylase [Planctomycetota bacterium]